MGKQNKIDKKSIEKNIKMKEKKNNGKRKIRTIGINDRQGRYTVIP